MTYRIDLSAAERAIVLTGIISQINESVTTQRVAGRAVGEYAARRLAALRALRDRFGALIDEPRCTCEAWLSPGEHTSECDLFPLFCQHEFTLPANEKEICAECGEPVALHIDR